MASVTGMKEKVHIPLYDALYVPGAKNGAPAKRFEEMLLDPTVVRFFVDIQDKTRLETNLQAAGVLPSLNKYEVKTLRVVVSSLNPLAEGQPLEPHFMAEFIYNSVTRLVVGEKIMIEAPTYYFPSGAGVTPGSGQVTNHGEPDPLATFRFAEPVVIDPQQNFRVEMLFPHGVPSTVKNATGPLRVWVVLDGYLTRDVQ